MGSFLKLALAISRSIFDVCHLVALGGSLVMVTLLPADCVLANPTGAEIEQEEVIITKNGKQVNISRGFPWMSFDWGSYGVNTDEWPVSSQPGGSAVFVPGTDVEWPSWYPTDLSLTLAELIPSTPSLAPLNGGTSADLGNFLASGFDISPEDFSAGSMKFVAAPSASLIQEFSEGDNMVFEPLGSLQFLETPASSTSGAPIAYGAMLVTPFTYDSMRLLLLLLPGPVQVPRIDENSTYLVVEGSTVSLDFLELAGNDSVALSGWQQVGGPDVTLNRPDEAQSSFFAPMVSGNETLLLTFERQRQNTGTGISSTITVRVKVLNSGFDRFAADVITLPVLSRPEAVFGISTPASGRITYLDSIDPASINDSIRRPSEMPMGLVDFELQVDFPGDTSQVVVHLDEPAPAGYGWFKYSEGQGWSDFSEHAEFNGDRTEVTLTLTDGGIGDDDGLQNGIIRDPSGLGLSSESGAAGEGAGGGCFIATAAFGSYLAPSVKILRDFRDSQLLNNRAGQILVAGYYRHSPPVAEVISRHPSLRAATRTLLLPLVSFSWLTLSCGLPAAIGAFMFLAAVGWVGTARVRRRSR